MCVLVLSLDEYKCVELTVYKHMYVVTLGILSYCGCYVCIPPHPLHPHSDTKTAVVMLCTHADTLTHTLSLSLCLSVSLSLSLSLSLAADTVDCPVHSF